MRLGSFNPRPPLMPGDPTPTSRHWQAGGSFNPRPALMPGDPVEPLHPPLQLGKFQSTPGINAGRSRTGAISEHVADDVSIHARH